MSFTTIKAEKYTKKIPFYNASSFIELSDGSQCFLQLDIDKNHKVINCSYQLTDNTDDFLNSIFKMMPSMILEKYLEDLETLSWADFLDLKKQKHLPFFNIPLILLEDAIKNFLGRTPFYSDSIGEDANDLLCRCFGVHRTEALRGFCKFSSFTHSEFNKYLSESKASLGCGSCKLDFENLYKPFLDGKNIMGQAVISYYNGMSQSEFVIAADDFITSWLSKRKIDRSCVEIMDVHLNQIFCQLNLDELMIYKLSNDFKNKFQVEIIKHILH